MLRETSRRETSAHRPATDARDRGSAQKIAGVMFLLAGVVILMGIITAETQYPPDVGYTTTNNEISDLGATRPPDSIITQPSATIFNTTMMISGAMIVAGAFASRRRYPHRSAPYAALVFGIGVLGVGFFPGNTTMHVYFAMTTFVFGGLTCILASRITASPFRYISAALGMTTLVFLFFAGAFMAALGDGGVERWVAYPVVLWLVAYGGYLLGTTTQKPVTASG